MRLIGLIPACAVAIAACSDEPTRVPDDGFMRGTHVRPTHVFARRIPEIVTASGRLAQEVADFGGAYIDVDGALVLTTVSNNGTPVVEAAQKLLQTSKRQVPQLKVRQVEFTYRDLDGWRERVPSTATLRVIARAVDEKSNRLFVGVAANEDIPIVSGALIALGIPPAALEIRVVPKPQVLTTLHSRVRPIVAAYRTTGFFTQDGVQYEKACTQGPNVTYNQAMHFVMNSHCTEHGTQGEYIGADMYQPAPTTTFNKTGQEVIDLRYSSFQGCPSGNVCRYSDAALIAITGTVTSAIAKVARPVERITSVTDSGSMEVDATNPTINLGSILPDVFVGDTLEKVGTRTGWTAGVVVSACFDTWIGTANYWQLCTLKVDASFGRGDSGAPVFFTTTSGNYALAGLLWGGLVTGSTDRGSTFFASQWRYVDYELGGYFGALDPFTAPDPVCQPPNPC